MTAEVVASLRDKEVARFRRLLPTPEELQSLGFGSKQREEIAKRIAAASAGFAELANSQKLVAPNSQWLQFGATRPGILPAGTDGLTKDVLVYDNVAAIIDTQGRNGQLTVGALISVGTGWRIIDLPKKSESNDGSFLIWNLRPQQPETAVEGGMDEQMQKLLSDLERVDKALHPRQHWTARNCTASERTCWKSSRNERTTKKIVRLGSDSLRRRSRRWAVRRIP